MDNGTLSHLWVRGALGRYGAKGFRRTNLPIFGYSRPTLKESTGCRPNAFRRGESDCSPDP